MLSESLLSVGSGSHDAFSYVMMSTHVPKTKCMEKSRVDFVKFALPLALSSAGLIAVLVPGRCWAYSPCSTMDLNRNKDRSVAEDEVGHVFARFNMDRSLCCT